MDRTARFERRHVLALGAALAAFPAWGRPRAASPDHEKAQSVVRRMVGQIIELLDNDGIGEGQEARERLRAIIERDADLDRFGRLVLGRHWRRATPAQRDEFLTLFRRLMLEKFTGYLDAYSGREVGSIDEVFEITGSRTVGGGDIVVETVIRPETRPPVSVGWRLHQRDGRPLVIDVIAEGVSLLISQRSEFASVIEQGGMDGLLSELRERLDHTRS